MLLPVLWDGELFGTSIKWEILITYPQKLKIRILLGYTITILEEYILPDVLSRLLGKFDEYRTLNTF